MNDEMRHPRVLRVLLVELLQNGRRFELVGKSQIGFRRRRLQGEGIEDLGLVIGGVALGHLFHGPVVGSQSGIERYLVMVAVIGAQGLDPVALVLRLRPDRASLFERCPGGLRIGPRRRLGQGVPKEVHGHAPIGHGAVGILL